MRSALPEEIVARSEGEDVRDTVFTVPLLRDCIINMIHDMEKDIELPLKKDAGRTCLGTAQEGPWKWFTTSDLGFPLVDVEYHRQIHPMIETYFSDCPRDPQLLDENEETGNLCDHSLHSLSQHIKLMLSDWEQQV